jgi:N-formylglutamate amidohydrolase
MKRNLSFFLTVLSLLSFCSTKTMELPEDNKAVIVHFLQNELQSAVNRDDEVAISHYAHLLDTLTTIPAAPTEAPLPHNDFIFIQRGTLPLILTAPHGGETAVAGIPIRNNPQGLRQFNKIIDDGTFEITQALSDALYKLYGARPYIVAARFHRKYLDANRPAGPKAYEHNKTKDIYNAYHGQITAFIKEIKSRFPQGALLLDIHAHGRDYSTIYRGTQDKTTVSALLHNYGEKALSGQFSILGFLENQGYTVYPSKHTPHKSEHSDYSGGYTVGAYGSHKAAGIDALQLELGYNFRKSDATRKAFAKDLAQALQTFCTTYLKFQPNTISS